MSALEVIEGIVTALAVNECCELSPWLAGKLVRWSAHLRYSDQERAEIRSEELTALIDERPGKLFKLITAFCFAAAAVRVWAVRTWTQYLENMMARANPTAAGTLQITTAALLSVTLVAALTVQAFELATRTKQLSLSTGTPYQPANIVVLVDESGSVTQVDLAREIQAVNVIADTLSARSWITVIGFGGVNGFAPSQAPTSVVCRPTLMSGPLARAYLSECTRDLRIRSFAEGNNTDYASALAEADAYIAPGAAASRYQLDMDKAILLLTNGGLDVSGDPAYPQPWERAAAQAMEQQLSDAQYYGAQLWTCWGVSAEAVMKAVSPGRSDDCSASYLQRLLRNV